ncbi:AraC family transcriptional regulator [Inconstantimicrobium mannanitabidum]|uniref:HTH-type transcriptional regulator YdeC n=1 Tax=Inconstantimicrobium mannanitabidum TaxID=1604901 RepID=A0ACB5RGJ3_9CLOT|nr:AraC family transcriptional regulator [Clostridium sp. TW13]GKX68207.1 putative HTH-type transcriptional regulator YdeC [Clostridium sp. TW13]
MSNKKTKVFPVDINRREIATHDAGGIQCISYIDTYFNNSYHWHWHDEFEIAFASKGSVDIYINNLRYTLCENDGIFINSKIIHKYANGKENIMCMLPNILFHSSLIYDSNDSIIKTKYINPVINNPDISHIIFKADCENDNFALNLIYEAFELLENASWGYELEVKICLSKLILYICGQIKCNNNINNTETILEINRLRSMMDYIKQNFQKQLTLKQIASSVSVSIRECQRCFEKLLGTTPIKYVNDIRIDYAKKLLSQTTYSLIEITELSGFTNQSYFTKKFRISVGITPQKYRAEKL